jgi:hypothetical protein
VNVKDFGAVCDNVTDDTASVQLAITAAGTSGMVMIGPQCRTATAFTNPNKIPIFNMRGTTGMRGYVSADDYGCIGDGVADDTACLQAAIGAVSTGTYILLPANTYKITAPLTVTTTGIGIKGNGFGSVMAISGVTDMLQVNAQLFRLEDVEIQVLTVPARTGAAIVNIQSSGGQGYVNNIRVTGNNSSTNNGFIFKQEASIGAWTFNNVRVSGGATWTSVLRVSSTSLGTCASNVVHNLSGISVPMTVAAIDIDGAIDTFIMDNGGLTITGAPYMLVRNAVGAGVGPRWIHCLNCFAETGGPTSGFAGLQLDSVRDFRWQGYLASSTTGVAIGANATSVDISHTVFINHGQSAVTIANGATDVLLHANSFLDSGVQTNNTYDTISFAANASNWKLIGNTFNDTTSANKPRYHVALSGTTDQYIMKDNRAMTAAATGEVNNGASGSNREILANLGTTNIFAFNTTFNGAASFNTAITSGGGGAAPALGILYSATAFASLGTPTAGTVYYCNDCTIANPCASGGTGAIAKRLNGVWVCN